jgi:hypothetical protein
VNLALTSRSALVILALLLAGCGSHRLNTFEPVDLSERSITVPPGGGLTGEIKQAMTRDGWRVVVRQGPEVTKGQLGEKHATGTVQDRGDALRDVPAMEPV